MIYLTWHQASLSLLQFIHGLSVLNMALTTQAPGVPPHVMAPLQVNVLIVCRAVSRVPSPAELRMAHAVPPLHRCCFGGERKILLDRPVVVLITLRKKGFA